MPMLLAIVRDDAVLADLVNFVASPNALNQNHQRLSDPGKIVATISCPALYRCALFADVTFGYIDWVPEEHYLIL